MKKDLFNQNVSDKVEVDIYADEIKKVKSPAGNKWHYIGLLIVPIEKETNLLKDLLKARYFSEFRPKNKLTNVKDDDGYFSKNNRVVHFSSLDADTYHVAKRWRNYIIDWDKRSMDKIYFSILGINKSNLDVEKFGEDRFNSIYNRFFRTAVVFPLLKFFYNKEITIRYIFHEEGEQQFGRYFPWHSIYKINTEKDWRISCKNKKVKFLPKSHQQNRRSNFIQLIDSVLGSFRNALDNETKRNEHKIKLTEDYLGLVKRLINNPRNKNSKYCKNYHRRMNISFFPDKPLLLESNYDMNEIGGKFYKKRQLVFIDDRQDSLGI